MCIDKGQINQYAYAREMENSPTTNSKTRENWFLKRIIKHQVITFTLGFLLLYQLSAVLISYFTDKQLFLEHFGLNIWILALSIPIIYFLQWLLVVWVASKFPEEKLKQLFLKHPIATIILLIVYITDLPSRLQEFGGGGIVPIFETIVYYAFVSFLWWLLICWISSKIFKKQSIQWHWYQKAIDIIFAFMPIVYKFILGSIVAIILFYVLFMLITVLFNYSGKDLKILFS